MRSGATRNLALIVNRKGRAGVRARQGSQVAQALAGGPGKGMHAGRRIRGTHHYTAIVDGKGCAVAVSGQRAEITYAALQLPEKSVRLSSMWISGCAYGLPRRIHSVHARAAGPQSTQINRGVC